MARWDINKMLVTVPALAFAIDRDERLVYLNGGLREQLGLEDSKLVGQAAFRIAHLPIKKHHFRKALSGESIAVTISLQGFNYETHLTPFSEDGKITAVTGLTVDMTKHMQLEQYLDDEKYRLLATQRLNSLAGVASGLAHEINNPLAIISGYAEQLFNQAEKGTLSPERLLYTARKLIDTCNRCHRIIESVKTFARDGSRDSFQTCSVNEWVDSTFALCRERYQSMGVALEWQPLTVDVTFEGRLLPLVQSLFNLLTNAFEAAVNCSSPRVKVSCEVKGSMVYVHVEDNGPGIPESNRVSIFEPFFTTKDQSRSVGIGLSTAKGMIEDHQGQLTFTELAGLTRFTICVPKSQQAIAAVS